MGLVASLKRSRVAVAADDAHDVDESVAAPKEDHVAANVRRPNLLPKLRALVADIGMLSDDATFLPNLSDPLPRRQVYR